MSLSIAWFSAAFFKFFTSVYAPSAPASLKSRRLVFFAFVVPFFIAFAHTPGFTPSSQTLRASYCMLEVPILLYVGNPPLYVMGWEAQSGPGPNWAQGPNRAQNIGRAGGIAEARNISSKQKYGTGVAEALKHILKLYTHLSLTRGGVYYTPPPGKAFVIPRGIYYVYNMFLSVPLSLPTSRSLSLYICIHFDVLIICLQYMFKH